MTHLGDFPTGATVRHAWSTTSAGTGSITRATNGTIRIYKDGSITQRSSAAGVTDTEDFDSLTGLHYLSIDLSDNTDAGFYAAGSEYQVVIEGMVVDGSTFNAPICSFSIQRTNGALAYLIANLGTAGAAATEAGGTGDHLTALATQTSVDTIDSNVDAILVDTGTTLQAELDGIQADTEDIQSRLPAALVGGRIDASVGAMAAGVVTASAVATDAIDADALAADAVAEINATVDTALADIRLDELLAADSDIDGLTPPTVGSVFHELMTKTAGSFTYDQTTDSLEAVRDRGDSAWITATGFSTHTAADVWSVTTRVLTANTNLNDPTAATIADAVWNEAQADHTSAGTFGEIATEIASILVDTGTTLQAELDGIQADTEDIQSKIGTPSNFGSGTSTLAANLQDIADNGTATFDRTTDSLQAIRDRGDSAWITATGFLDAAGVRSAVGLASANLDTQLAALPTAAENADAVLDEALSGHTTAGTLGKAVADTETDAAAILVDTAEIGTAGAGLTNINLPDQTMNITGNITGNLSGTIGSLGTTAKSDVNAEVVDALSTDAYGEPGQGAPGASISLKDKIGYLYKAWRNKSTQTATTLTLYADDTTTTDQTSTVSDDGTTFTRGEMGSGA